MIEIAVTGATKEYELGSRVLDGLSFSVQSGERVGILGRNGAGKTTLFRMLTGDLTPDSGTVAVAPGRRLGLISQIPVYPSGYTVGDVLETAFAELRALETELKRLSETLGEGEAALLRRYDSLTASFESAGGYEWELRLAKICNGLGLDEDFRRRAFAALSGGEKTRVNLARLLLVDTDILLLDEPTNHLDLHATEWLEDYLSQYKGTVLAISHDRYFLDRVIRRVVEIQDGKGEEYPGNYSFYAVEKERRFLEKQKRYEKEQAKISQLQGAADKLHLWAFMGNDKLHKRAFSMEKRIERLRQTDKPKTERKLRVKFGERAFQGDEFYELCGIGKSFGEKTVLEDVSLQIESGDRIALLGDNGAGKSTLLKIITGEWTPDRGRLRKAPTLRIGCLPQQITFAEPSRSLVDTLLYELGCTTQEARDKLASFQFRGEDAWKRVSNLSGGEQSRLRLCMLMNQKINFLLLDEPTNHLDLHSREWIEDAVEEFEETLLFVSHDRYFIDRFATRIWVLKDGAVTDFHGDYRAYLAWLEKQALHTRNNSPPPKKNAGAEPKGGRGKPGGGTKQLKKEQNAAYKLLQKAEEALAAIAADKDANAADYIKLQDLLEREEAAMAEYEALFHQWEALTEQVELLENV